MEDIHNFQNGLHTNFDSQNQPPNTYRDAWNWVRLEDGSLINEYGTVNITSYPITNYPIGSIVLGEESIIFSYVIDEEPEIPVFTSEIGVIDSESNYTTILVSEDLGFLPTYRIKGVAKKDYRGHRLIYFIEINGNIPFRYLDLDSPTPLNVEDETKGFITSELPVVIIDSITEDGNLPSGIYQFSARLLTDSSNPTAPSILTNVVPIIDESYASGVTSFDGSLPQTNSFKSINLTLTNLDTSFPYVQVIATTYEGLTNTIKSNVVGTLSITNSTMNFTYSSLSQNGEELTLDELTVEPLEYSNPKAIEHKDGRLLLGNLSVKNHSPNMQAIANQIGCRYKIKEVTYSEDINVSYTGSTGSTTGIDIGFNGDMYINDTYKRELNTTNYKGYQRDEVYSFAIVPIFKNLATGYAYHIPALNSTLEANTTTKEVGRYEVDGFEYPEDMGFDLLEGEKVRYHKMPSMFQEPIYDDSTSKIRILGVEFYNIDFSSLPDDEKNNIIGYIIVRELRTEENKSIIAQGIVNSFSPSRFSPHKIVSPFAGKPSWEFDNDEESYFLTDSAFYSPETTILRNNMSGVDAIKPVANMQGDSYIVADRRDGSATYNEQYAHFFLNYKFMLEVDEPAILVNKSATTYVGAETGVITLESSPTTSVSTYSNNGFLYVNSNTDLPIFEDSITQDRIPGVGGLAEITYEYNVGSTSEIRLAQSSFSSTAVATVGVTRRRLFNLISNRLNQYGGVLDKEYMLVRYKLLAEDSSTTLECYSGDTFINKNSIVSTTSVSGNPDTGLQFRTLSYFFCESTVNTAYRHHHVDESGTAQTVNYYPRYKKFWNPSGDGLLQVEPRFGHANGYNKQYSFDNTIKKYFSKPLIQIDEVSSFSNRVIYSEQSIEGEQLDSYRIFMTNNYHDIPKSKGEITNIFVSKNDLFIHTSQSLWKSSFNERVTQSTSAGEVVLGNGGIFPRPSVEIFPINGGYAGSIDSLATCNTPYGTYFVDKLQKKIFYLGDSFEEVDAGMSTELSSKLDGIMISTFDYTYDRWLLSGSSLSISYFPKLKSYTSHHDYRPNIMYSVNTKVFLGLYGMHELNIGIKGKYLEQEEVESSITFISNSNPLATKTFDNIRIDSTRPFTELTVDNGDKVVGKFLIDNDDWEFEPNPDEEQRITKINSEYRLAVPQDLDERRFKGKWCSFKFVYDNSDSQEIVVKYINVIYRINAR